jgi:hypothetical protein
LNFLHGGDQFGYLPLAILSLSCVVKPHWLCWQLVVYLGGL